MVNVPIYNHSQGTQIWLKELLEMVDKQGLLALLDELDEVVDDLRDLLDDGTSNVLEELENVVGAIRSELKGDEICGCNETHNDLEASHWPASKDFFPVPVGDLLVGVLQNYGFHDSFEYSPVVAYKSGFAELDCLMDGGFRPGSLNIIASRPSMGKTSLALNIAQFGGGESNAAVLIFSLESPAEHIVRRMLAAQAGVSLDSMVTGTMSHGDRDKLSAAAEILKQKPIFIDDSSMLTTSNFCNYCREFREKHPNLGLIVVDYLQLIAWEGKAESRKHEMWIILRELRKVADELNCPIIISSQLPRKAEKGADNIPTLFDLCDTPEEAVEQFADTMMFLHRKDYYEGTSSQDSEARLVVVKSDNGRTGEVSLMFQREIVRFRDEERI